MQMIALRNRLVNRRLRADLIALQHRDRVEEIGQDARSHQTRDAAADDDCVLTESIHHPALWLFAALELRRLTAAALDSHARRTLDTYSMYVMAGPPGG